MSDGEQEQDSTHRESIARIKGAADGMLAQVLDLLDEEKIEERSQPPAEMGPAEEPASTGDVKAADSLDLIAPPEDRSDFKILVVENCAILRDVLVSVLRRRFHVVSAVDGWEALTQMAEAPDLVLTELDLPRVNAAEMLRHIQHMVKDIAVLAMYDAKDKDLLARAQSLGVRDALLKPFGMAELVQKVDALAQASGTHKYESVLVVCPEGHERCALYSLLDTRYRTHIATSAEAAIEMAEKHFDLLITDVSAANQSWQKLVAFFQKRHRSTPLLGLIDGSDDEIAKALARGDIDSALSRPYGFDELLLCVHDLLGIKEIDARILRSVYRELA